MGEQCIGASSGGTRLITKHAAIEEAPYFDAALEIKEVAADGTFSGYGSVFNNVDSDRDVIMPGAFGATLRSKKPAKIKLLYQHDPKQPIGIWEEMREDQRGLYVKGRLLINQNVPEADKAYSLLKAGAIDAMSIGFMIPAGGWEIDEKKRVRKINEVDLWEVSLVTFPANDRARVSAVKANVPFQDLPLADRGRPWDGAAAEKRVRQWAGGGTSLQDMDWTKYRRAFLWYDSENAENVTSYKLGVADIINGELTAVPRGIFAAAGVLMGARGGVDIPADAQRRAISHLERYYSKMDMDSPFKAVDMGDAVKSYNSAMMAAADGPITMEQVLKDLGFSHTKSEQIASAVFSRGEGGETHDTARETPPDVGKSMAAAFAKANDAISTIRKNQ